MRDKLGLTLVYLLATASVAFATNGANLIGLTPQTVGQAGTGIARYTGVESIVKNPALLPQAKSKEALIGANYVSLDPQSRISYSGAITTDTGYIQGNVKTFAIPEMGLVVPVNSTWAYGVGLFGTSGFGVDYRNQAAGGGVFSNIRTHLMAFQIVPGVGYTNGPVSVGLSTHITYSVLNFSAWLPDSTGNPTTAQQRGGGLSESIGASIQVGGAYQLGENTTAGLTYQTSSPLSFAKVFDFDRNGTYDDFELELPAELGIGFTHRIDQLTLSLDGKQIYWSTAKGFKNLRWNDQSVIALGAKYDVIPNKFYVSAGYSFAPSVISNRSDLNASNGFFNLGGGQYFDSNIAYFDVIGFGPAVVGGKSFTLGAGYAITESLNADLAFEYLVPNTVTQSGKTSLAGANDTDAVFSAKSAGYILSSSIGWKF